MGIRGQRIIRIIDLTCQTDHERGTQVYTHTHTHSTQTDLSKKLVSFTTLLFSPKARSHQKQ